MFDCFDYENCIVCHALVSDQVGMAYDMVLCKKCEKKRDDLNRQWLDVIKCRHLSITNGRCEYCAEEII